MELSDFLAFALRQQTGLQGDDLERCEFTVISRKRMKIKDEL